MPDFPPSILPLALSSPVASSEAIREWPATSDAEDTGNVGKSSPIGHVFNSEGQLLDLERNSKRSQLLGQDVSRRCNSATIIIKRRPSLEYGSLDGRGIKEGIDVRKNIRKVCAEIHRASVPNRLDLTSWGDERSKNDRDCLVENDHLIPTPKVVGFNHTDAVAPVRGALHLCAADFSATSSGMENFSGNCIGNTQKQEVLGNEGKGMVGEEIGCIVSEGIADGETMEEVMRHDCSAGSSSYSTDGACYSATNGSSTSGACSINDSTSCSLESNNGSFSGSVNDSPLHTNNNSHHSLTTVLTPTNHNNNNNNINESIKHCSLISSSYPADQQHVIVLPMTTSFVT